MPSFPVAGIGGYAFTPAGEDTATSKLNWVTSGSANAKGSWFEYYAATPHESFGLWLYVTERDALANNIGYRVDVGIGALGSEIVIVPDIGIMRGGGNVGIQLFIPIYIPRGVRVSVRLQAGFSSEQLRIGLGLCAFPLLHYGVYSHADAYGLGGGSDGTNVAPNATSNTKGAYQELVASTSHAIKHLIVCVNGDGQSGDQHWLFDLAVGAVASEIVIASNLAAIRTSLTDTPYPAIFNIPVSIPAGTRIAARCQAFDAALAAPDLQMTLLGLH